MNLSQLTRTQKITAGVLGFLLLVAAIFGIYFGFIKKDTPKPKTAQTEAATIEANKRKIIANKNQAIQALTNLRKDVITKITNLMNKNNLILGLYSRTEVRVLTTPAEWLRRVNAVIDARSEASNSAKAFAEKLIYAIEMARAEQRDDGNLVLASSKVNEAITAMTTNINNKVNDGLTAMTTNINNKVNANMTKIEATNVVMTQFESQLSNFYEAIFNDDKNQKVNPSTSELETMLVNAQKFAEHYATAYAMSFIQKTNMQIAGHIATM